ncbi:tRNA (N6-threonylcarbamoyladenosine(37)-N6)-methyltransferase TrmO [Methanochimaera problematica]|nr:tRNA (N6-threonylcarbamoyladenosine(37)-N6)-methyltransferase TrmO [Methanoplanus sp. FWC-SCC4]
MYDIVPIGVVKSPYLTKEQAPSQGRNKDSEEMVIEIFEEYQKGLGDYREVSHLIVLLWFDQAKRDLLFAKPPYSDQEKPVFTTRSPNRPNPVGFDIGRIISVDSGKIMIAGLDAIDNTPVIDIKPYIPSLDCIPGATEGKSKKSGKN